MSPENETLFKLGKKVVGSSESCGVSDAVRSRLNGVDGNVKRRISLRICCCFAQIFQDVNYWPWETIYGRQPELNKSLDFICSTL
jgi:hypothetical protein